MGGGFDFPAEEKKIKGDPDDMISKADKDSYENDPEQRKYKKEDRKRERETKIKKEKDKKEKKGKELNESPRVTDDENKVKEQQYGEGKGRKEGRKDNCKKEKKEMENHVVENVYCKDETNDKDKTAKVKRDKTKDKDRYNLEKLKKKLAKLDAKMEKIIAKRKDYLQRLKEAEQRGVQEAERSAQCEILNGGPKDAAFESLARAMGSLNVSSSTKTDLSGVTAREEVSEQVEKTAVGISYPKIEEADITGVGY